MARFLQFDRVSFAYPGMAEPLLASVTAHFPEGQLDIVMNNKDVRRGYSEEMRCLLHGDPAFVHVGLRLEEDVGILFLIEGMELGLPGTGKPQSRNQTVAHQPARVVPALSVLDSGIAQKDYHLSHISIIKPPLLMCKER